MNPTTLLILAGIGQICLSIGSTFIPGILGWKSELQKVTPFLRHIFWVYAVYILTTNFSFGLISLFAPKALSDGSQLASLLTGFMFVYWVSRLGIQFFYFKREFFPTARIYKLAEVALVSAFIFFTSVYAYVFYLNTFIN